MSSAADAPVKTALATAPATAERVLRDLRALHDVAAFDPRKVAEAGPMATWAVLRLNPGETSGAATIIGAALDADTGRIVDMQTGLPIDPRTARQGEIREGSWHLVDVLRGKQPTATGRYSWIKPAPRRRQGLRADDLYEPFARGGVVLSLLQAGAGAAGRFEPSYVFPPGWESDLRGAVADVAGIGSEPSGAATRENVRAMLASSNRLVSVKAFQYLAEGQRLDAAEVGSTLRGARGYQRAAMEYVALRGLTDFDQEHVLHAPSTGVDDGQTDAQRAAALAVAATAVLHPRVRTQPVVATAMEIVQSGVQAAAAGDGDPYLGHVAKLIGTA